MINEENLTEHYSKIANKMDEMIPVDWEKIALFAEQTGDSGSEVFYFYTNERSEPYRSLEIPEDFSVDEEIFTILRRELFYLIRDLWYEFKNAGEETWETLTFTLNKDWSFDVKFGYKGQFDDDDMGPMQMKIILAYNELGLIPKGDFSKKLLQEYLDRNNLGSI